MPGPLPLFSALHLALSFPCVLCVSCVLLPLAVSRAFPSLLYLVSPSSRACPPPSPHTPPSPSLPLHSRSLLPCSRPVDRVWAHDVVSRCIAFLFSTSLRSHLFIFFQRSPAPSTHRLASHQRFTAPTRADSTNSRTHENEPRRYFA